MRLRFILVGAIALFSVRVLAQARDPSDAERPPAGKAVDVEITVPIGNVIELTTEAAFTIKSLSTGMSAIVSCYDRETHLMPLLDNEMIRVFRDDAKTVSVLNSMRDLAWLECNARKRAGRIRWSISDSFHVEGFPWPGGIGRYFDARSKGVASPWSILVNKAKEENFAPDREKVALMKQHQEVMRSFIRKRDQFFLHCDASSECGQVVMPVIKSLTFRCANFGVVGGSVIERPAEENEGAFVVNLSAVNLGFAPLSAAACGGTPDLVLQPGEAGQWTKRALFRKEAAGWTLKSLP